MLNIHLSATPVLNASRILKQTSALEQAGVFGQIVIVGHNQAGAEAVDELSSARKVVRVPSISRSKSGMGIAGKLVWFSVWMVRVFLMFSRSGAACVNAHSVSVLPLAWALSVRTGACLVYDPHELETKTSTMIGVQGRLCGGLERLFIKRCDAVFVVSEGIADWYAETYQILRPVVVRNLPDVPVSASDGGDLRRLFNVGAENLLFVHVGSLTTHRNIDNILDAFTHPDNRHHVVFLGHGPLEPEVLRQREKSSRIHLMDPVPPNDVVGWIRSADVGLCLTEVTCLSNRYALPNKIFECVTAGLPIVATYLEEVHRIFGDEFLSMVVPDVHEQLTRHVLGLDTVRAHELAEMVAGWRIPQWQDDATRMIDRYADMQFARGTL